MHVIAGDLLAVDFAQQLDQAVPDRREIFDEEHLLASLRLHDRKSAPPMVVASVTADTTAVPDVRAGASGVLRSLRGCSI